MLHRSFKPAKCKTSLKLATSRIKLLRNKKDAQLKQLKREVAQLLESGQDQTARIRVEHVVREEKMIAAFELIEIYCELIAARLPIIESQKNCPIDLKEAIASVVFASPRCADIPELLDVRKHFTAKYGKEFISAAVELRPECGVSRMLVEKLSAKAPDGQTKIKILSAIAEEHNIKWDPKSFEEKELKPPDDLLNGPNTFQKASQVQIETPIFQAPPSTFQVPLSHDQQHDYPVNFGKKNTPSTSSQNFASNDIGGSHTTKPATSHPGGRPSGTASERMEVSHSHSRDEGSFPLGEHNWNMEFTDATAAAQAAAESAERASMAARAAAELSSRGRIARQGSTESQNSNIHSSRNEGPGKHNVSKVPTEYFGKNSGYVSQVSNPHIQHEPVDRDEHDNPNEVSERIYQEGHGRPERSRWSASQKSSTASIDNDRLMNDMPTEDRRSGKHSFEEEAVKAEKSAFSGMTGNSQFNRLEGKSASSPEVGFQSENVNYFGEEKIRTQATNISSFSQLDRNGRDNPNEVSERFYREGHGRHESFSQSDSEKSSTASIDNGMDDIQKEAAKAEKSSFSGVSMNSQPSWSEGKFAGSQEVGSENFNYFGEERFKKQASSVCSFSHSSNHVDDYEGSHFSHQEFEVEDHENPFFTSNEGSIRRDTVETSSYDNAGVVFDEYGFDDEGVRFDPEPRYDRVASLGSESKFYPTFAGDTESSYDKMPSLGSESKFYSTSPYIEQPSSFSINTDNWSPRQNRNEPLEKTSTVSHVSAEWHSPSQFDENLTKKSSYSPQPEDFDDLPPKFDDFPVNSDHAELPDSESEYELDKSRFGGKTNPRTLPHKESIVCTNSDEIQSESHELTKSFLMERGNSASDRQEGLHYSSDDEELDEVNTKSNQQRAYSDQSWRKFDFGEVPSHELSSRHTKSKMGSGEIINEPFQNSVEEGKRLQSSQSSGLSLNSEVNAAEDTRTWESLGAVKDDISFDQSSLESGKELNFGTLTGGFRNKGYIRPPYVKRQSDDVSSSIRTSEHDVTAKKESVTTAKESVATIEHSPASPAVKSSLSSGLSTKVENKTSLSTSIAHDDLDTEDSEEEITKQSPQSKRESHKNRKASKEVNIKSKFSPPSNYFDLDEDQSEKNLPKQTPTGMGHARSGISRRTKPTPNSRTSSYSKATDHSKPSVKSDISVGNTPSRGSYTSEPPPKPQPQTETLGHWKNPDEPTAAKKATSKPTTASNVSTQQENLKPSVGKKLSSPLKTVSSASTESSKTSTSTVEPPSRESSLKKASHVHPKLPDYDTIAAQFQSLRLNRQ
ncbi:hypothetical protein NMG60_11013537 [Bertholletia excelsa]